MSLINDALRDLETRQGKAKKNAEHIAVGASDSQIAFVTKTDRHRFRPYLFTTLSVLLFFAVWLVYWNSAFFVITSNNHLATPKISARQENSSSVEETNGLAESAIDAGQELSAYRDETSRQRPESLPAVPAKNVGASPVNATSSTQVQTLLARAQDALEKNRLSLPKQDNALFWFAKVKAIEPENPALKRGMSAIIQRYEQLLDRAYDRADLSRMVYLLDRVTQAALDFPAQNAYQEKLSLLQRQQHLSQIETAEINTVGRVSIEKTKEATESAVVANASNLVNKGDTPMAIGELKAFLAASPASFQARVLLQDIYFSQHNYAAALDLAEGAFDKNLQNYMKARILVHQNELSEALAQLQQINPGELLMRYRQHTIPPMLFVGIHELSAALHQKSNAYQQAIAHYKVLLDIEQINGAYWLGMALCSDALGLSEQAVLAYRKALILGVDTQAEQHARQRIDILADSVQPPVETSTGGVQVIVGAVSTP